MAEIPRRYPLLTEMRVEARHVSVINKALMDSSRQLEEEIKRRQAKGNNPLTIMQLQAQKVMINRQLAQDWDNIERAIQQGKVEAVRAASTVVSRYEAELLKAVLTPDQLGALSISEANRAARGMEVMLQRVGGSSYVPLSKSVYRNKALTTGLVDAKVNQALVSGWSHSRFAKEVRDLIDPAVPGGVSYAANRLARTEIQNAFHASSAQRFQESGLVDGVDWNLSSSHPEGDICDQYAEDGPYPPDEVPAKPHPHCYCFITPSMPSEDEFLDKLLNGDYGEEPWIGDTPLGTGPSPTSATGAPRLDDIIARVPEGANVGDRMSIMKDAFREVYEDRSFGEFTLRVRSSQYNERMGKTLVEMDVLDGSGRNMGAVVRSFNTKDGKTWVYHDLMSLEEEARGKGFSSAFSKYSEQWYKESGMDHIKVHAALSDGGYAWGRAGYTWDMDRYKAVAPAPPGPLVLSGSFGSGETQPMSVIRQLRAIRNAEASAFNEFSQIGPENMSIVEGFLKRFDSPDISEWPTPSELANAGAAPVRGSSDTLKTGKTGKLGKLIMAGTDWHGVKKL